MLLESLESRQMFSANFISAPTLNVTPDAMPVMVVNNNHAPTSTSPTLGIDYDRPGTVTTSMKFGVTPTIAIAPETL